MNIGVIGAGTWGVALAKTLSKNHEVTVWCFLEQEACDLKTKRTHPNLPGMIVPANIEFTTDMKSAVLNKEILIIVTPSNFVRSTMKVLVPNLVDGQILCCASKGIEPDTLAFMSDIIADEIKTNNPIVALSGPTHAEEVALDKLTLIVSSSKDEQAAKSVQNIFLGSCIRAYTNEDIIGVELCAALKNIIALACGIATGLGYGDNTKAALITRGISEIKRLGLAMNCKESTFLGLAGIGDLIVTATSQHSRNNRCGQFIGQGIPAKEAIEKVGMVVEGVNALPAAMQLSKKYNVDMPITNIVNDVINNNKSTEEAVSSLFTRDLKSELI